MTCSLTVGSGGPTTRFSGPDGLLLLAVTKSRPLRGYEDERNSIRDGRERRAVRKRGSLAVVPVASCNLSLGEPR
jgi:hypothetical protein